MDQPGALAPDETAAPEASKAAARERAAKSRENRKAETGRCLRCPRKGLEDGQSLCPRCLKRKRKATAKAMRELRRRRRDASQCVSCGCKVQAGRLCTACKMKQGRIPQHILNPAKEQEVDQWRPDNDGWRRFRGKGRRGAPAAGVSIDQDLQSALDALTKGRHAMAWANSPEVQELPRIQRRSAMIEATSQLALCARFIDEIVDKFGGIQT